MNNSFPFSDDDFTGVFFFILPFFVNRIHFGFYAPLLNCQKQKDKGNIIIQKKKKKKRKEEKKKKKKKKKKKEKDKTL